MRKIEWAPPYIDHKEKQAVMRVMDSGWYGQGPECEAFEKELASYLGSKNVVTFNNGTSSLISSLIAQGIGPGDEVIVPTYTFIASINSILTVGAKPVLVDIDPKMWNTTPELVLEKVTKKTKAFMPVDIAGMTVDIDAFTDLARDKELIFLQDSAQSMGCEYKGKKVGNFDHLTSFSFHVAKIITTVEGGCVSTNDDQLASKLRIIRNNGMHPRYRYQMFGLNMRMMDLNAAIGREQLKKLNGFLDMRNKFAKYYKKNLNCEFQEVPSYIHNHTWMLFGILIQNRDLIMENLRKKGIDTRSCWPPAHQQEYHKKVLNIEKYPNADQVYSKIIDLPMGSGTTMDDIQYVVNALKEEGL